MQTGGPLLDDPSLFHDVVAALLAAGFAEADVEWAEGCREPEDPAAFALEAAFVICNSGMQNKVARTIFEKVRTALLDGRSASEGFGHDGKAGAIDDIWKRRASLMDGYLSSDDKIAFCRSMPWIGGTTCYHLAKSFGAQVAKPDVHLKRLAERHGTGVQELCEDLAARTGFKVPTIDVLLWRACAERILDPRTSLPPKPREPAETKQRPTQQELFEPVQQELFG
jgi:hypothetical protein